MCIPILEILKLEKPIQPLCFSDQNNNAYLIGQVYKKWTISVYKQFNLKTAQTKRFT
jgi:hypothetical protein